MEWPRGRRFYKCAFQVNLFEHGGRWIAGGWELIRAASLTIPRQRVKHV